jgi:hypothetical protein
MTASRCSSQAKNRILLRLNLQFPPRVTLFRGFKLNTIRFNTLLGENSVRGMVAIRTPPPSRGGMGVRNKHACSWRPWRTASKLTPQSPAVLRTASSRGIPRRMPRQGCWQLQGRADSGRVARQYHPELKRPGDSARNPARCWRRMARWRGRVAPRCAKGIEIGFQHPPTRAAIECWREIPALRTEGEKRTPCDEL